jgi:hypothetical protein
MNVLLQILPPLVVAIHLAWILWVIMGALWTRGRPWLTAFHVASLLWGIIVETCPVDCPFTLAEQTLEAHAGLHPWSASSHALSGGFLFHTLDALVYPNVPVALLITCAVAVCALNLGIYAWRLYQFLSSSR